MVESEESLSARLAHCLFDTRHRSFDRQYSAQPFFAGLLERAKRRMDPSLKLERVRFFLHNGELESENHGNNKRAYLCGQILTLVEFGKQVFISRSRLTRRKILRLNQKGFAAIFGPSPRLTLVDYPIAKWQDQK